MDFDVPVYVFTGFLESGKTSFIRDTLNDPGFNGGERTLYILCEEGFEEFSKRELKKVNAVAVSMDSLEDMSLKALEALQKKYKPERVFIEYNGMWLVNDLLNLDFPKGWAIVQIINLINAQTFNMYVTNMRSLVYEHAFKSDLVIFNRCEEDMNFNNFRSTIKAINGSTQIGYEDDEGILDPVMELPYDINKDFIDVEPHNYGIFCMDLMENPEPYIGKKIHIQGQMIGLDRIIKDGFILGRQAMVCCEQDTSLVGLVAVTPLASKIVPGEWVDLTGYIYKTYDEEMEADVGVLNVNDLNIIPAYENPYVTFD